MPENGCQDLLEEVDAAAAAVDLSAAAVDSAQQAYDAAYLALQQDSQRLIDAIEAWMACETGQMRQMAETDQPVSNRAISALHRVMRRLLTHKGK